MCNSFKCWFILHGMQSLHLRCIAFDPIIRSISVSISRAGRRSWAKSRKLNPGEVCWRGSRWRPPSGGKGPRICKLSGFCRESRRTDCKVAVPCTFQLRNTLGLRLRNLSHVSRVENQSAPSNVGLFECSLRIHLIVQQLYLATRGYWWGWEAMSRSRRIGTWSLAVLWWVRATWASRRNWSRLPFGSRRPRISTSSPKLTCSECNRKVPHCIPLSFEHQSCRVSACTTATKLLAVTRCFFSYSMSFCPNLAVNGYSESNSGASNDLFWHKKFLGVRGTRKLD